MMPHKLPGKLIVFEGVDGCGKTEQMRMAAEKLKESLQVSTSHITCATPGGTPFGEEVRRLLFTKSEGLSTHNLQMDVSSLLYLASHIQSWRTVVRPALAAGKIVLHDRWDYFSGQAFANAGKDPVSFAIQNLRLQLCNIQPDLTFFFHGDSATFLARAKGRVATHQDGKAWSNTEKLDQAQTIYRRVLEACVDCDHHLIFVKSDELTQETIFNSSVWPAIISHLALASGSIDEFGIWSDKKK